MLGSDKLVVEAIRLLPGQGQHLLRTRRELRAWILGLVIGVKFLEYLLAGLPNLDAEVPKDRSCYSVLLTKQSQ